jgi:hypothetical protein
VASVAPNAIEFVTSFTLIIVRITYTYEYPIMLDIDFESSYIYPNGLILSSTRNILKDGYLHESFNSFLLLVIALFAQGCFHVSVCDNSNLLYCINELNIINDFNRSGMNNDHIVMIVDNHGCNLNLSMTSYLSMRHLFPSW